MKNKIIILCGISASGKTSIQREMCKNGYHKVITSTTRSPRVEDNEVHGKDYYFYDKDDFKNKITENYFAEHEFHGENIYGTPWDSLKNTETIPCAILEPKGAKRLKELLVKKGWDAKVVWIDCSFDIALERIKSRDDENQENLNKRIKLMNTIEKSWHSHMKYDLKVNGVDSFNHNVDLIKNFKKNKSKKKP